MIKRWWRELLIRILFRLLGNYSYQEPFFVQTIFGRNNPATAQKRRKRWENGLVGLWHNKDLIDFLFYQAECDKENVWRNKHRELAQGARIRTLFLVKQAREAHLNRGVSKSMKPEEQDQVRAEIREGKEAYKKVVDIGE
jgi:hypothetical protein